MLRLIMRKTYKTLLVIAFSSMGAFVFVNIMAFFGVLK